MGCHGLARAYAGALGVLAMSAVAAGFPGAQPKSPPAVDFVREIKPILGAACVRCHAGGFAQGNLRLDTREGLLRGGATGAAIVPGDGRRSALYQRLILEDPKKRMPWLSEPLTPAQAETVRLWIDAGAPWPEGLTVSAEEAPGKAPPLPAV